MLRRLAWIYTDVPALRPGSVGGTAFAVACAGTAAVAALAFEGPLAGPRYFPFLPAIAIATLVSGVEAGLVCTACSAVAVLLLGSSAGHPADTTALLLFAPLALFNVLLAFLPRLALSASRDPGGSHDLHVAEPTTTTAVEHSRAGGDTDPQPSGLHREFAVIYERGGIFLGHLDTAGTIVDANPACVEGLGFTRGQIIAKPFWEAGWWRTLPEDRESIRERVRLALAGQETRAEARYISGNDEERVGDMTMTPITDDHGRVVSIFVVSVDVTERARRYRVIFENATVGIVHATDELKWATVNDAMGRIVGCRPSELIDQPAMDSIHPDDRRKAHADVSRLRNGDIDNYTSERRYLRKDGGTVWIRASVAALRNDDGSIASFVGVIEDITDRKRAQELLHRQADLLDQSLDPIFTWTSSGGIAYWNRGAEVLYGYPRQEAIGRCPHELLQTRSATSVDDIEAEVARRGSWEGEVTRTARDGRKVSVLCRHAHVAYDDEELTLETNRDITQRKEAEDALRDSEERLRAIYDGTYQYTGLLAPNGTVLDANRASLEFVGDAPGGRRDDVTGRPFWDTAWFAYTPGERERVRAAVARAGAGEFTRYEMALTRPSGEEVIFDFSLHPVKNARGEVSFIVPEGRIITDRKRAEEELAKSEERFRSSIIQSPVPTMLYDDREQILAVSRSWLQQAGGIAEHQLHKMEDWATIAYGERATEILDMIRREIFTAKPELRVDELPVHTGEDCDRLWRLVSSCIGMKSDGRQLFITVAQDITDQKAYEERIDLLMREARHRTKNILGLVQAVARQTASTDPHEFTERFSERVQALATNQDLLGRREWQRVDVMDLVQGQLEHFSDLIGTRINFGGTKVNLNPTAAQAIGLAIHELATNAGKYGALSTESGRLDISWKLDDGRYVMDWIESNGPPVQPPRRQGFGTKVTKSMLEGTLAGEVQLDYARAGLRWHLSCPKANALAAGENS